MKRLGEPWDVAYMALFLASEEAKYVTGQIVAVDGGLMVAGVTV
jgi:3-oxoacyl-[acyl-carrier protein] reductase